MEPVSHECPYLPYLRHHWTAAVIEDATIRIVYKKFVSCSINIHVILTGATPAIGGGTLPDLGTESTMSLSSIF